MSLETEFRLNKGVKLTQVHVGAHQTPVLLLDDFADGIESLKSFAVHQANFEDELETLYPGVRAKLPRHYVIETINSIMGLVFKVYGVPVESKINVHAAYFGLVARAEDSLSDRQRIPHYDNLFENSFAILHYINPGRFGGTGFFRHKPTSFELISHGNVDEYIESSRSFLNREAYKPRGKGYISESDEQYELIGKVDYSENRLLLYPSGLLHSGLINPLTDLNSDPSSGRLTATLFFSFH